MDMILLPRGGAAKKRSEKKGSVFSFLFLRPKVNKNATDTKYLLNREHFQYFWYNQLRVSTRFHCYRGTIK